MNLWNRMVNGLVDKNLRFKKNATITIENSSGAGVTTLSASELRARWMTAIGKSSMARSPWPMISVVADCAIS